MEIFYIIIFFMFGLVLGSFYNVVGIRLCTGESLVFPGSHCMKCNHKLKFYENIPVFSYIFLRGKCRKCKCKISIMYPVVELFTAILFAVSYYVFGFSNELILALLICSLFCIIVVSDLNYYIIPDSVLIFFFISVFVYNVISFGFSKAFLYVFYGLLMFLFMFLLGKLGNILFKEESLGGGDIKLMGVLGCTCVPFMSFAALTIGSFVALPSSLFFYLRSKDKVIPFGPFIIAGFLILIFMQVDMKTILDFITFD